MRAYQCDRCSALYSDSNKLKNEIFITDSCTITGKVKDLCNECQKELESWWTEKKKKKEAEMNSLCYTCKYSEWDEDEKGWFPDGCRKDYPIQAVTRGNGVTECDEYEDEYERVEDDNN